MSSQHPKIAYLVNVYPAPSHSFIRREILALEELGWQVARYSVRRTESPLHDAGDQREAKKTYVLLEAGVVRIAVALVVSVCRTPIRFVLALRLAWKLGRRSERGRMYHAIYLAEACLLKRRLVTEQIEHVHAHFGTNSTTLALLCYVLGGPGYSFTVHGPEEFDKGTALGLKEKIRHASFVVAISQFGRSQLYRWSNSLDWSKIHVVHCGLDASYLDHDHSPVSDSQRFVCVGRLCEQKGQLLLVDAFARLINASTERSSPNVAAFAKMQASQTPGVEALARTHSPLPKPELVLVGDGPMRPEIEARIDSRGIRDHVRITGWASGDTVQKELAAARTIILPSFAEGLPVVLMEALAMERPVISTYVAGIPELVRPGENGWLVPAGDVDALVAAMHEALETPVERLQEMGCASRKRVFERHNIRSEVVKLSNLFRIRENLDEDAKYEHDRSHT